MSRDHACVMYLSNLDKGGFLAELIVSYSTSGKVIVGELERKVYVIIFFIPSTVKIYVYNCSNLFLATSP